MQKLLRRTPSAPPILSSPLSLPISNTSFLSLRFCDGANKIIRKMSHSTHHLRQFHPLHQGKTPFSSAARGFKMTKLPRSGCRPCSCSADSSVAAPLRAWVVLKESNRYSSVGSGSHRAAWYATVAGNSSTEGEFPVAEGGGNGENAEGEEEKKLPRRRGGGSGGGAVVVGSPDLLTIPGVGPRNLRKLVEKGFEGVAQLKQLYKDKFYGKSSEKMVEFLRSSVGIIHKNHAESITTFIKESVDEELKEDVKPVQKKRITLCVEGNISVGKTTFLQRIANETLELQDLVEIVPEPVDKWQNVGPNNLNILEKFYAEPERYAYTFQNYVFATRVMQERESCGGIRPLRLMERSVFSDRMVFVRAVHEAKWMNEMEISIYDSWFDPVVSVLPGLIPDGFIYLRASPDTCHKRMMLRQRAEEGGVSLDYLRDLHEKHESWLFPFQSGNHGVLSVSEMPKDVDWSLHPSIKERVFYLKGDHMHSCIQKVPALVLDCEPDIDFSRDIEAKREYARQVAEFFELVKKKKEVSGADVGEVPGKTSQSPVVIPGPGKLWMPGTLDLGQKSMTFMPH